MARSSKTAHPGEASLFESSAPRPLAEVLRPMALEQVVGQDHILGPDGPLGRLIATRRAASMILWGPPGCGKTTIARLLADAFGLTYEPLSAVFAGVADLRRVFDAARERRRDGKGTLLFIDEIHRFNKAQQDGLLPVVEDGTVILVGATTENPSFELNAALLSRTQVLVLRRLDDEALERVLCHAEEVLGKPLNLVETAREALRAMADGDGRYLLTMAEQVAAIEASEPLQPADLVQALVRRAPVYDKGQESHYNLISALHKSLRGSDCDAALYWLARMILGGEDGEYIARRLVRFAVEDIGLADPQALPQAIAAWEAFSRLGTPQGELALAQAVLYLATSPKSNAGYTAWKAAQRDAKETGSLAPPAHILNAPTKLMKSFGYGDGYQYDHDAPDGFSGQNYFPDKTDRRQYYQPVERGFEREVRKRLEYWDRLRKERS